MRNLNIDKTIWRYIWRGATHFCTAVSVNDRQTMKKFEPISYHVACTGGCGKMSSERFFFAQSSNANRFDASPISLSTKEFAFSVGVFESLCDSSAGAFQNGLKIESACKAIPCEKFRNGQKRSQKLSERSQKRSERSRERSQKRSERRER